MPTYGGQRLTASEGSAPASGRSRSTHASPVTRSRWSRLNVTKGRTIALRLLLFATLLVVPIALAQPAKVVITGGFDSAGQRLVATGSSENSAYDASGQNYAWIVTNNHTSPIVYVEFPHYHADTFHTPDGWDQKCTN